MRIALGRVRSARALHLHRRLAGGREIGLPRLLAIVRAPSGRAEPADVDHQGGGRRLAAPGPAIRGPPGSTLAIPPFLAAGPVEAAARALGSGAIEAMPVFAWNAIEAAARVVS